MQQKQHVDYHRKIALRKRLLVAVDKRPVRCYVPFIGEGDIATELYFDMEVFGADIEPDRVAVAKERLKKTIIVADCDHFPFKGSGLFDVADFDAYAHPYKAFRSFWEEGAKSNRMVLFFTDGDKQSIIRSKVVHYPDGRVERLTDLNDQRKLFNFYFPKVILPWFTDYIEPYRTLRKAFYLRKSMLYWGAVIENA